MRGPGDAAMRAVPIIDLSLSLSLSLSLWSASATPNDAYSRAGCNTEETARRPARPTAKDGYSYWDGSVRAAMVVVVR